MEAIDRSEENRRIAEALVAMRQTHTEPTIRLKKPSGMPTLRRPL